MPTHGLVLGKFAPLHRGHQLLIETALRETEQVTVVVYDAREATRVPLEVRAGWVRALYPAVRVVLGWTGPKEVGDTPRIRRLQEDYVIRTLGIRGVTHFYSSEFYGEHMSAALGAIDRRIDPPRATVPISGTAIRSAPFAHRAFLDPFVYRDFVARVVLLGAPSTGKTTLAAALAQEFRTAWMPEYGREYWERHQVDRRLSPEQLVEIVEGHREREDALAWETDTFLFCDTNALTTYVFALAYHGFALPRLAALAEESARRYDAVFLCGDEMPYDDTEDRSGPDDRLRMQRQTEGELLMRRIPFRRLSGSVAERIAQVRAALAGFEKWRNPFDALPGGPP